MGMIRKTVTGNTNKMKLVQNGKNAPVTAKGGTKRTKFTGSNDTRPAGPASSNRVLKSSPGYIDQGPVTSGDTSWARKFNKPGKRGSTAGAARTAKEKVTGGMGGTFWKEPTGF